MFVPLPLEFYLNYTVSNEIQGLSSIDHNFQGLSRTFKERANPEFYICVYIQCRRRQPTYRLHLNFPSSRGN